MNVLVTGACGQVGAHVTEMLLERGNRVLGIDNLATGRCEHLVDNPQLRVAIGSIANRDLVNGLVEDFTPDVPGRRRRVVQGFRELVRRYADQLRRRRKPDPGGQA
jgi:nucleoside-diphosphate-sugar epimerase